MMFIYLGLIFPIVSTGRAADILANRLEDDLQAFDSIITQSAEDTRNSIGKFFDENGIETQNLITNVQKLFREYKEFNANLNEDIKKAIKNGNAKIRERVFEKINQNEVETENKAKEIAQLIGLRFKENQQHMAKTFEEHKPKVNLPAILGPIFGILAVAAAIIIYCFCCKNGNQCQCCPTNNYDPLVNEERRLLSRKLRLSTKHYKSKLR